MTEPAALRTLLVIPPMVEVSLPYPSTAYLTGFIRALGRHCDQRDLSLELFRRLFCEEGLERVREVIASRPDAQVRSPTTSASSFFFQAFEDYRTTIDETIGFLRGEQPTLALRIAGRGYLPEGMRFVYADRAGEFSVAFGRASVDERARFVASLYLFDIADAIREGVDENFAFPAYGSALSRSAATFDALYAALHRPPALVDRMMSEILDEWMDLLVPDVVGFTAPFFGNIFGALKGAQLVRARAAAAGRTITVVLGGGYVNTELRDLEDARIFELVDYLTFDDGERPLLALLEHLEGTRTRENLVRTRYVEGTVIRRSLGTDADVPIRESPTPTYAGLDLGQYVPYSISPNPVMRMWTSYHWNKLTLAHGCYWRKCTFCDVSLDYIQRYEPDDVERLLDKMEALATETGRTGFHFVDEAAPPALLRALSEGILARGITPTWWTNIRFESYFTPEVTERYALAGCVAVTGGLEVASDRLLKMMKKGVTIAQVSRAAKAFADAGIRVHAYLMYAFPTQTLQELVDSLEIVRQMFIEGCLHSGAWHKFTATEHAPVLQELPAHGITLLRPKGGAPFARYAVKTTPVVEFDAEAMGAPLNAALLSFMNDKHLKRPVTDWFSTPVPQPTFASDAVRNMLAELPSAPGKAHYRVKTR